MEWASDKVIKVTAQVFHSPVLFGLSFSVSLVAVLVAHRYQDKEGRSERKYEGRARHKTP